MTDVSEISGFTPGPWDVGTTTLIEELRGIARSIDHHFPNSCEKRAADCLESKDAEIARLRDDAAVNETVVLALQAKCGDAEAEIDRLREKISCAEHRLEIDTDDLARLRDTNCDHGVTIARLRREKEALVEAAKLVMRANEIDWRGDSDKEVSEAWGDAIQATGTALRSATETNGT